MVNFSLIIPTLNEEAVIQSCISGIRRLNPDTEIIVADGGSTDDTVPIARSLGARLYQSESGRGIQCNAGAGIATGEVLVFLHADTQLPAGALKKLGEIFSDDQVQCGTFRLSFDSVHWFLRLISFLSLFDFGLFRFGDQCLVIRKSFFESIGGFSASKLFEDMELVRRARKRTRIMRFPMTVTTSARRFLENGVIRQHLRNSWYTSRYLLGVSPEKLAVEYEREDRYLRDTSLVVFLRYPRSGSVKTRLGASLGVPTATDFYRRCANHLSQEVRKLPKAVDHQIWYVGGTEKEMADWLGRGLSYLPQPEGNLGTRLAFALNNSFQKGAHKVIALASDVPDLSAELIIKAFRAFDRKDMVIGPTFDGGYYLIGMKQPHPEFFQGISWSTNMVYQQTLAAAGRLGISYHSLTTLNDIDTREDLLAWRAHSSHQSPVGRFAKSLDLEAK